MNVKGFTIQELADKLGISYVTAHKRLQTAGIKPLTKGVYLPEVIDLIRNVRSKGRQKKPVMEKIYTHIKKEGAESFRKNTKCVMIKLQNGEWVKKHIAAWEAVNGKIPPGHKLLFADKNKLNCDLSNLILVTNRELFYLNKNGLISDNAELTQLNVLQARLTLALYDKMRKPEKGHYAIDRLSKKMGYV